MKKNLDTLAAFDFCRFPSLRQNTIIPSILRGRCKIIVMLMTFLGRYNQPSVQPPTLQEYVSAQLKSLETGYKKDIWQNWQHGFRATLDPAEGERKEQIFYDDLFDKAETFLNQTVPQLCDKIRGFVEKTQRSGDTSIGDFIMSHLLPVQMDTLIKFVKFIRCSRTSDPSQYTERTIVRLINDYDPQTPLGLEGVNIGEDAASIQTNLLSQVMCVLVGEGGLPIF